MPSTVRHNTSATIATRAKHATCDAAQPFSTTKSVLLLTLVVTGRCDAVLVVSCWQLPQQRAVLTPRSCRPCTLIAAVLRHESSSVTHKTCTAAIEGEAGCFGSMLFKHDQRRVTGQRCSWHRTCSQLSVTTGYVLNLATMRPRTTRQPLSVLQP